MSSLPLIDIYGTNLELYALQWLNGKNTMLNRTLKMYVEMNF
jgi:hypothetical protein